MPAVMHCPFYMYEKNGKLSCEGASLKFPDKDARSEYVLKYCTNSYGWRKCPIAHYMENYYFRKDEKE